MSDDKAIVVDAHTPSAIQREDAHILDVISRAAADPAVDVGKMEQLLAMHERVRADQRRTSYMAALARLQATLPQIAKSGTILDRDGTLRNKYAKLEDIDVVIRPLCAAEGFSFSFDSAEGPKGTVYSCKMSHQDGHAETKTLSLPLDSGPGRGPVQNAGSSLSYAKRYLLGMHLHLVTREEDNDGNGAREPITAEQVAKLKAELTAVGGTEERFLKWLAVESFESIPVAMYVPALKYIEEKKRTKKAGST